MKKQITFNQLKRLVKEARFGDKLKSLDDPAFTDTQDEYNVRKLRAQMLKDMASIEKNEDLPEAIQLVEKMDDIVQKRKLDLPLNREFLDGDDTTPGCSAGGTCYGIVSSGVYGIFYNPNDPNDSGWCFNEFDGGPLEDATSDGLVNAVMSELTPEDQKQVADAIHKMASELNAFLGKVEEYYNEFVDMPGIKVSEGRFAGKLKALDKVGEGRFAKQLASLDAMMERGDEPVKLNEGTKVTLTLKQLKKLVKESTNDEFPHWFEIALKNLKSRVADLEEVFSSVKKGDVTPADADKLTDFVYDTEKNLKFMLKLLGKVKGPEVKEGIDDEDDEGPADVDTAVKEGKSWPKDIEYDDEEIDMVDEPKKSNKDEKQKSPTTDRAEEIRAKIREIEKERDSWIQQDDEEYKRYQSFEDRAGWTTRAKANKIRDGFFDRMNSFRSFINDCNKRLEALNKELIPIHLLIGLPPRMFQK